MSVDVVVVGGGTAGLSAALVLARSCREVVLIDAGEPRNMVVESTHGYLSCDGVTPDELLAAGRREVAGYGGRLLTDRVVEITGVDTGFVVERVGGPAITTRAVLMATGLRDELPAIPGVREQWGAGVLHCPYCHGYEVRGAPLAVVGGENRPFSVHQAALVRQWSADIIFFPNKIVQSDDERRRLTARSIRIIDGDVGRVIAADGQLRGIEMATGEFIPRTAVFVGPRFTPRDGLLTRMGCSVGDNGWVVVDDVGCTSIPGVWAAGNVADSPAQLVNAAAAGSKAAISLNHFLLECDIQAALSGAAVVG
jgi:thioredoxin reductase